MKNQLKIILSSVIIFSCFCCLYFLRSVPVSRIWKNYQVLYVENSVSEQTVLNYLEDAGCRNVISLSGQKMPVTSRFSPVQFGEEYNHYLEGRKLYFRDKSGDFRLYYIPDNFQSQTVKAVQNIGKITGARCGIDGKSTYPWLVPSCAVLFFIFLLFVSKYKALFFSLGFLPVLFSVSKPFYPVAAGVCLFLLGIFFVQFYYKRKYFLKTVFSNFSILFLTVSSVIVISVTGIINLFIFLLVIAGCLSFCFLNNLVYEANDKKYSFNYSPIIPATFLPKCSKSFSNLSFVCTGFVSLILVLFFTRATFAPGSLVSGLSLPSPVSVSNVEALPVQYELPSLFDYIVWSWNTATFPYKNLNKDKVYTIPQKGQKISQIRYKSTENGIVQYSETVAVFDNSFIEAAEKTIDSMDFCAVEKLLKKQGMNFKVEYLEKSRGAGASADIVSLLLIILCMILPLVAAVYCNVYSRKRLRILQ